MPTNRRKYDDEFKKRAVRLSYSSERPVTEVAKSLGITTNMIYLWRKKYTPEGDKTKMAQQQEVLFLIIPILQVYILQEVPVYLILCGRR